MKIFDLHAHPSFKAYGNMKAPNQLDIWSKREHTLDKVPFLDSPFTGLASILNRPLSGFLRTVVGNLAENTASLVSQSNLEAAIDGRVKCIVLSIYPIEREFFTRGRKKEGGNQDKLLSWISGHSNQYINKVQKGDSSYWDQFNEEIKMLDNGQNKNHAKTGWKYKIITNFSEFQAIQNEDKTIGIIFSAEGIQSLASNVKGQEQDFYALKNAAEKQSEDFKNWRKALLRNIKLVKEDDNLKKFTPFTITIAHHFFNYVCGHCKSLPEVSLPAIGPILFRQDGEYAEDGNTFSYYDWGFVGKYGKDIIRELLRRDPKNNVRRIIIDIKHMSPKTRREYYAMLQEEYNDEKIPIICSHTSCNGIELLDTAITESKSSNSSFMVFELNTYNEDIRKIYETNGLMGIMLDDGRICSKEISKSIKTLDDIIDKNQRKIFRYEEALKDAKSERRKEKLTRKIEEKNREITSCRNQLKDIYCDNFFRQVFHVVNVLQANEVNAGEKAWDILSIGSDYDGSINPMDLYGTYANIDEFAEDLIEHWKDKLEDLEDENAGDFDPLEKEYEKYLFGKSPSFWIDKVFWQNAEDFLKAYFHDDYLIHGKLG